MFIKRASLTRSLIKSTQRGIQYTNGSPYNVRFQKRFRHAFVTEPLEDECTRTKTPEESKQEDTYFGSWIRNWNKNYVPYSNLFAKRSIRSMAPFDFYVLPTCIAASFAYFPVHWVFKFTFALPALILYTRVRDKTEDPQPEETFMREMLHSNEKLGKLFKVESTQILDYECEYDKGFLDSETFPEFENKLFRFFACDGSTTTGNFTFGDVESNAVVRLNFKTMPIRGENRYMVGEPFYFYEVKAELNVNGVCEEFDVVNKEETLKNYRPFLIF